MDDPLRHSVQYPHPGLLFDAERFMYGLRQQGYGGLVLGS